MIQRPEPYPGDHTEKRAARLFLYQKALAAPTQGHALTLAGTDPKTELMLMRDYLRWPASRAWFIDNGNFDAVDAALAYVRQAWPGARTSTENVKDVIPRLGAIGFANLDFMGSPLHPDVLASLHEVSLRMLPGAILGFTWLRGREHPRGNTPSRLLWKLGKGYRGNERRWAGVLRAVDTVSDETLALIGKWEYRREHSPISVAVFRKEAT